MKMSDPARLGRQRFAGVGLAQVSSVRNDRCALRAKQLHGRRAHEVVRLGDQHPLACQLSCHQPLPEYELAVRLLEFPSWMRDHG